MSGLEDRTRDLIGKQAADWFVANRAGLDSHEHRSFDAWLRASPIHIEEYLRIAVIARDLPRVCADPDSSVDAVVARARTAEPSYAEPFWRRLIDAVRGGSFSLWPAVGAMATLLAIGVGLGLWHMRPNPPAAPSEAIVALHFTTRHGEQRTYRLADASLLHLNTDSSVTIRYSKAQRLVVLDAGEAVFEVVHDPQRAFRVDAGAAQVVDLGTRFDVRLANSATLVTVVEGRVAVARSLTPPAGDAPAAPDAVPESVQVSAGEQTSVSDGSWPPRVVRVDAGRATAWLQRQIIFESEPLERVASEFNRYAPTPIEIVSPELRKLEISGVFATDDASAFIAFLRSLEGVRVEVTATRIRVSQEPPRAAGAVRS